MARTSARTGSRKAAGAGDACCSTQAKLRAHVAEAYARFFRAFGDEIRMEMVGLLAARGKELCVCELESHFDLSQPTVSHHLRILREAGIVAAERRGTWVYYTLHAGVPEKLRSFLTLLGA